MLRIVLQLGLAITLAVTSTTFALEAPHINVPSIGKLVGSIDYSAWNKQIIYQFQAIPYALPPSEHRRFKPPQKMRPWKGLFNATSFGKKCPQANTEKELNELKRRLDRGEDVEDCLTLNVYTPINPKFCSYDPLPVMFYIHGGSFRVGSAQDFRPNYLLDNGDIVLVVIQYRLGPLGFLSLQTEDIPGNMGLMDMVMALQWTQDNIKYFCGDPTEVTIFGQSSGAAAVSLMLASPMVKPSMFQRVIIQSGSSLCDWAVDRTPEEHAIRIAALANCTEESYEDMVLCLHKTNAWALLIAHSDFLTEVLITEGQAVKGNNGGNHAVIQVSGSPVFLKGDPLILFRDGQYRHVPMMVGVTKHEGSFFLGNIYDFILERNNVTNDTNYLSKEFIKATLQFSGIVDTTGAITDVFEEKFFKEDEIGNFTAMTPGLIDICGITLLKACTLQQIRQNYDKQSSYLYSFNYKGNLTKFGYGEDVNYPFQGGVAHSDDLIYLFPDSKGNLSNDEAEIAKTVVKLWTSFARTGKPSVESEPRIQWPPMSNRFGPYLRIDDPSSVRDNFLVEYNITITEGLNSSAKSVRYTHEGLMINIVFIILINLIAFTNLL
ncbi:carboxylesterase 4A-like [Lycorma delicatula]|uniref:carboxylesterase 4A-like n=1 Tax=Lycorma delicatula TaxID=130591 RepID=UPI003F510869